MVEEFTNGKGLSFPKKDNRLVMATDGITGVCSILLINS